MKSFNRMTEKQMSKVDGGFIWLILGAFFLSSVIAIGGAAIGIGVAAEARK